jgi:hypothetical protein
VVSNAHRSRFISGKRARGTHCTGGWVRGPQSGLDSEKLLYTSVVKFPASTSEGITETLFQFVVICKIVVGGCQIWAVSRMAKNSPSHFFRLPHVCASWCEAGHCREGEGRLSSFSQDDVYGCVIAVCLNFAFTTRDVLRS